MIEKQITLPTQTYMNKQNYLAQHVVDAHMRRTLMLITDKTVLQVTSAKQKVVADKFCERFDINCTVKVIGGGITGASAQSVIIDDLTHDRNIHDIYFRRMMGLFLK